MTVILVKVFFDNIRSIDDLWIKQCQCFIIRKFYPHHTWIASLLSTKTIIWFLVNIVRYNVPNHLWDHLNWISFQQEIFLFINSFLKRTRIHSFDQFRWFRFHWSPVSLLRLLYFGECIILQKSRNVLSSSRWWNQVLLAEGLTLYKLSVHTGSELKLLSNCLMNSLFSLIF